MKRLHTRLPGAIQKERLDEYLMMWLPTALGVPAISKTKVRILLMSGAVYVNRHRNHIGATPLFSGTIVEVYYDEEKMSKGMIRTDHMRLKSDQILYEDEWLIVINKPVGIPTQPTVDPGRANLFDLVKKLLLSRVTNDKQPYVGLHHRLDKDTSGLVLFTKKEEANKGVANLFMGRNISKIYHCVTTKTLASPRYSEDEKFEIESFIGKAAPSKGTKSKISRFCSVRAGGDYAQTNFKVLDVFRDAYWLEVEPQTGRTHQIRVHCSENKIPILGDKLYFPKEMASFVQTPRLLLHACILKFEHPFTHQEIEIEAPLPDDFVHVLGSLMK